jgi:hypothetical protein
VNEQEQLQTAQPQCFVKLYDVRRFLLSTAQY